MFTPALGNLVSFRGLTFAPGSAIQVIYDFEVRNAANTAYFAGPLTLRFRNTSGGLVIDDVTVDVIGAAATAVPEPATWAMMIGGFGMVGAAMRRQRRTALTRAYA